MVEMAIATVILIALLGAIMQMGWVVKNSNTIVNASREGARLASLGRGVAAVRARVRSSSVPMTPTDSEITLQFYNGTDIPTEAQWLAWPADTGTGMTSTNNVPVGAQLRVTVVTASSYFPGLIPALQNRRIFQYTVARREL